MFADFDLCGPFIPFLLILCVIGGIKAWWNHHLLHTNPRAWEALERQKRETRHARWGVLGFLLRIFLGDR